MKRKVLLYSLLFLFLYAEAAPRTENDALSIAQALLSTGTTGVHQMPAARHFSVAAQTSAYMAVNTGSGFVLVGADDRMPEILGWTDQGEFQQDNLPPALKEWLAVYEREYQALEYIASHNEEPIAIKRRLSAQDNVFEDECSPLLTTNWGQGEPYNNLCPLGASDTRCLTGCVATAMSQIMKYHEYPVKGTSSHSYTWKCADCGSGYNTQKTLTANFGNTTYDWSNMLDRYTEDNYTTTQANAVATLMFHCGVAVEMAYGLSASGSNNWIAANAMSNYFGYGKDIQIAMHDYFSTEELMQAIHDDLLQGHPVMARGVDEHTGGHAFVCDGYTKSGYFHFNWGWEGTANGYFLLSSLNPMTGNRMYRFNISSHFFTNIHPDAEGSSKPHCQFFCDGIQVSPTSGLRNATLSVQAYELRNYNPATFTGNIGIGLYDEATDSLQAIVWQSDKFSLDATWGWTMRQGISFSVPATLPNGTYHINVIFRPSDNSYPWEKVRYWGAASYGAKIFVTKDGVSTEQLNVPQTDYTDSIVALTIDSLVIPYTAVSRTSGLTVEMHGLQNKGDEDFYGYYGLAVYSGDSMVALVNSINSSSEGQHLPAGYHAANSESFGVRLPSVRTGEYTLQPVCRGTLGAWRAIVNAADSLPVVIPFRLAPRTILIEDLSFTKPMRLENDTVTTAIVPIFVLPNSVQSCQTQLAAVFSNSENALTDTIDGGSTNLSEGEWHWNFNDAFIATEREKGVLVNEGQNTITLLWRLTTSDDFKPFAQDGYSTCTFALKEVELPAKGDTITCQQADELAPWLSTYSELSGTNTVIGYATAILSSVSKNQQRFWMADTPNGGNVFQCYYGNVTEEIKKGYKVAVTGHLVRYNTFAEIVNGTVEILEQPEGIEDILTDKLDRTKPYRIFNLQGLSIGTDMTTLPHGVYLIVQNGKTIKVVL